MTTHACSTRFKVAKIDGKIQTAEVVIARSLQKLARTFVKTYILLPQAEVHSFRSISQQNAIGVEVSIHKAWNNELVFGIHNGRIGMQRCEQVKTIGNLSNATVANEKVVTSPSIVPVARYHKSVGNYLE